MGCFLAKQNSYVPHCNLSHMILRVIKRWLSLCMRFWLGKNHSQIYFSPSSMSLTCRMTKSVLSRLICFCSYTHDIEALSCDEVLIDGSALVSELGISPEDLAKTIRVEIKEKTGCCASVGMGEFMCQIVENITRQCLYFTNCSSAQDPTSCWLGWQLERPSQMASTS